MFRYLGCPTIETKKNGFSLSEYTGTIHSLGWIFLENKANFGFYPSMMMKTCPGKAIIWEVRPKVLFKYVMSVSDAKEDYFPY